MESDLNMHISDPDDVTYLIHHLFLPPKLPQEDDSSSACTQALLQHVTASAADFLEVLCRQNADIGILRRWCTLQKMLKSMKALHQSDYIHLEDLRSSINGMEID